MPHRKPSRASSPVPGNLLTTKDVAALLRVHPKQVYRLMRRDLPALRVGDEWRFDRDSVLSWAAHSREHAPEHEGASPVPGLLAANGDVVVDALLAEYRRVDEAPLGFVLSDHAGGVKLLRQGFVLAAGCHGGLGVDGDRSGAPRNGPVVRLQLVAREVGLAGPPGARLKALGGVVGKRLALRAPTSGVRRRLDDALREAGIAKGAAYRRSTEHACHRDVALAVARGDVDVGLTTHAWAHAAGLSFFPVAVEDYDVAFLAAHAEDARLVRLCEAAQTASFRRRLRACAGYDVARTGRVRLA